MAGEQTNTLNPFLNRFVTVVFQEQGRDRAATGLLENADSSFVFLKGDHNSFAIALKDIVKIKASERGKYE